MFKRFFTLIATCLAMAALLGPIGCVEEAQCREACEHTCDICDSGCSELQINTCTQSCEDGQTAPERAKCVLETDLCEDLWRC
ncbi:MAG: hypothetical protein RBU30_23260 [Polyangia bacterium]|jgi:hypothetical protein|nr:hypothetical protein [Polyangia bacterium]